MSERTNVEVELNILPFFKIVFYRKPRNTNELEYLYTMEMPRAFFSRWMRLIRWRRSKFICLYPFDKIDVRFTYFDKTSGLEYGFNSPLSRLVNLKSDINIMEERIADYIKYWKERSMFFDESQDHKLQKAINNKERMKSQYHQLERAFKIIHPPLSGI